MPDHAQRSVTVRVPATSANLGPGFDSLGVALDWTARITIVETTGGVGEVREHRGETSEAADPIGHMAVGAALAVYEACGAPRPSLQAHYEGDMPVGRGLGISAAARAAGVVAANALLGGRLPAEDVLRIAVRLEGHGDNAIPALLGGLQVVVEEDGTPSYVTVPPPGDLRIALLVPDFNMPTHESRKRLPESLTRREAVHNIGRAALMVAALTQHRYDLLHLATQDVLHQPARSTLFPAMLPIFEAARAAGAHGAYLSGGGSTIAAFVTTGAEEVADAMRAEAAAHGLRGETRVVQMSSAGAEVVDRQNVEEPR